MDVLLCWIFALVLLVRALSDSEPYTAATTSMKSVAWSEKLMDVLLLICKTCSWNKVLKQIFFLVNFRLKHWYYNISTRALRHNALEVFVAEWSHIHKYLKSGKCAHRTYPEHLWCIRLFLECTVIEISDLSLLIGQLVILLCQIVIDVLRRGSLVFTVDQFCWNPCFFKSKKFQSRSFISRNSKLFQLDSNIWLVALLLAFVITLFYVLLLTKLMCFVN